MIVSYIRGKEQTIGNDLSRSLSMDEAYLIMYNRNSSENITLFGNKVVCENCNLGKMSVIAPNKNRTIIINTQYAYDLEIRSSESNESILCQFKSYKFHEHGTYVLHLIYNTPLETKCSIEQIGKLSAYAIPAILGVLFVILYTTVVQLWQYIDYRRIWNYFRSTDTQAQILVEDTTQGSLNTNQSAASNTKSRATKRLRSLDTFRGFSLMVMIFVNYGGGGYWFFDHSTWNGLTLADLVFPWFTWMMGVSIVLSQRSLRSKNVRKRSMLVKICRRTLILILLGMSEQPHLMKFRDIRFCGVLQRLATCYFFTAILVLCLDKDYKLNSQDEHQEPSFRVEFNRAVFQYWLQWLLVTLVVIIWVLITFLLQVPDCPTGYIGPGGKHDHGKYSNCTGGAAGYIDRVVLGNSHLYDEPTCKEIYSTKLPYDPEGLLGNLTGILLCYLGVQAGHIFVHSNRVHRICSQWLIWSIICGCFGLGLSFGGHSDSWIPINKNLWSLTFVFTLASLAFVILSVLYVLVDVRQWFTGAPFLWLGMNSIAIYMCHGLFGVSVPVQFDVSDTHAAQLAMHLYGAFFWSLIAGLMYYKKVFIAI
ncbi:unnamed protein product [Adineta ricciae]|uniref:Heparan-alpha-glucosaminide N-acetyltransferase-like protein n=2 Tax=Adineta ricciae TaxID=249248 RepID=A0A814F1M1_ADIRI|nr:unnamed protein product [Adineta ricciae]